MTKVVEVHAPESYAKAAKDMNWCAAMEEKMQALDANDTWDLVDPPQHCKPVGYKWVYKVKYNANGVAKMLACLCYLSGIAWVLDRGERLR